MKFAVSIFLCLALCSACAKQKATLADGKPGYKVHCEMFEERCFDEIRLLCGDKSYTLVAERESIVRPPLGWIDRGGNWKFSSRFWKEVRCE